MAGEILKDPGIPGFNFSGDTTAGQIISQFFTVGYFIVGFLAFYWLVWGVFQYILARGDKEQLAHARARIIWAIVGLVLFALAFSITQFVQEIFPSKTKSPISLVSVAYAEVNIGNEFGFGNIKNLGEGTSILVTPVFSIAVVLVTMFFLYGAFKILKSGGDKNEVQAGRDAITHAIIGFVLLMGIFLILNFVLSQLFGLDNFHVIKGL
jgi:hypothetical protein